MQYPGQCAQIDVKFVPNICVVGQEEGTRWYQYAFIDQYNRFRYLEAFQERGTYSSAAFIKHCVQRFPDPIECVQTDNGLEFTNRLAPNTVKEKATLFIPLMISKSSSPSVNTLTTISHASS